MKTALATVFSALGFFALAFFAASPKSERVINPPSKINPVIKRAPVRATSEQSIAMNKEAASTALASVSTADYEITIYGAFAFTPDDSFAHFMKTDSGYQFVVLDMAMQNLSKNKSVDIGQVLLSATVTDEDGNIYPRNALALEAFEMQYPEQSHKAEYKAMRGKIKPGAYYRTTAYGFEAPENLKHFFIEFPKGSKPQKNAGTETVAFSIE